MNHWGLRGFMNAGLGTKSNGTSTPRSTVVGAFPALLRGTAFGLSGVSTAWTLVTACRLSSKPADGVLVALSSSAAGKNID